MPRDRIFEKLVMSSFRLEPAQRAALRQEARARKISDAELLRWLIDTYIIKAGKNGGGNDVARKNV